MTAQTFTFIMPAARALNSNKKRNHYTEGRIVLEIHAHVRAAMADVTRLAGPVDIDAALTWGDNRRRDAPNWWPTLKAAIDQAVILGVLVDDSNRYVAATTMRPMKAQRGLRGYLQMCVTFTERESGETGKNVR